MLKLSLIFSKSYMPILGSRYLSNSLAQTESGWYSTFLGILMFLTKPFDLQVPKLRVSPITKEFQLITLILKTLLLIPFAFWFDCCSKKSWAQLFSYIFSLIVSMPSTNERTTQSPSQYGCLTPSKRVTIPSYYVEIFLIMPSKGSQPLLSLTW